MLASIAWGQQVIRVKSACIKSTGHESQSSQFQQEFFLRITFGQRTLGHPFRQHLASIVETRQDQWRSQGVNGVKFHPLSDPRVPFSNRSMKHCKLSQIAINENECFTCFGGSISSLEGPILGLRRAHPRVKRDRPRPVRGFSKI